MKLHKIVLTLALLFVGGVSQASAPIFARDGCIVKTRFNRHDTIPFYLVKGDVIVTTLDRCPTHNPDHFIHFKSTELLLPFTNRVVGFYCEHSHGSQYIEVNHTSDIRFFPGKDVYDREKDEWNFADLRDK